MEDLRKAANYYLETASEGYKKRAQKAIDDGESLEDFYVRKTKRCIRKCDVCSKLVFGFYFCCTKCELFMKGYNYNLCVDCFYGGRTFEHEHDTFADNHSVLMMHTEGRGEPSCVIEQNNGKGKQDSNSEDDASSSHPKSSIPHHDSSFKDSNFKFTHHDSSSHSKSTHHDSSSHSKSTQTSTAIEKRNNRKGKQDSNSKSNASSSHPKSIPHGSSLKDTNSHSKSTQHDSSSHSKSTHHDSSSHSKSTQTRGSGSPSTAIEKRNNGKGKQDSNSKSKQDSDSKGDVSSSHSKSKHHDPNSHSKSTQHDSSLKVSSSYSDLTHRKDDSSSNDLDSITNSSIHSKLIISKKYLKEPSHSKSIYSSVPAGTKIKIDENAIKKLAYIADAHYNAAPDYIRANADKFFWNMVKQKGKTSVTMEDFVESMKEKSYPEYANQELFEMVVKDRNVGMVLSESRTVFYIVVSARPFCSWCRYLIPDIYFCCSKCSARSYALCLHCYSNKAYVNHRHYKDHDVFFLDYTVLHNTIKADTSEARGSGSPSTVIEIRKPRDDKVVASLKVGRAILNAGATILSIASTLGVSCTIM